MLYNLYGKKLKWIENYFIFVKKFKCKILILFKQYWWRNVEFEWTKIVLHEHKQQIDFQKVVLFLTILFLVLYVLTFMNNTNFKLHF